MNKIKLILKRISVFLLTSIIALTSINFSVEAFAETSYGSLTATASGAGQTIYKFYDDSFTIDEDNTVVDFTVTKIQVQKPSGTVATSARKGGLCICTSKSKDDRVAWIVDAQYALNKSNYTKTVKLNKGTYYIGVYHYTDSDQGSGGKTVCSGLSMSITPPTPTPVHTCTYRDTQVPAKAAGCTTEGYSAYTKRTYTCTGTTASSKCSNGHYNSEVVEIGKTAVKATGHSYE